MLFRTETRSISKKGSFTIPVQIRRALGIYSKTQVDIKPGDKEDVLMVIKTRPHCICCGKVGKTLVKADNDSANPQNTRYVCEDCITRLNTSLERGITITHKLSSTDVIDNYNINLLRLEEIAKENSEYEKIIQQEGLAALDSMKTVSLSGNNSNIKVQISYTVKDVTSDGFTTLKKYMNQNVSEHYLSRSVVEKFNSNSEFKKAAVLIYTRDFEFGSFFEKLEKRSLVKDLTDKKIEMLENRWKLEDSEFNVKLLEKLFSNSLNSEERNTLEKEITQVAKGNYVKHIFPKIKTLDDVELLRDCLLVSSCVKIKK